MRYFILTILLLLNLSSCASLTKDEQIVNSIIHNHSEIEKRNSGLELIGSGSAIPDDVHGCILHYVANKMLTIPEARKLYINSSERLLKMINENSSLRPFMYRYPFTSKDLEYGISFYDRNGYFLEYPYVALISVTHEEVYYSYYDRNKKQYSKHVVFPKSKKFSFSDQLLRRSAML